ncbi:MAG: DUF2207 domain-containing protein [Leptospira sp.]|nr:DUF2207 domain-containing protein [Leptospira sp.]
MSRLLIFVIFIILVVSVIVTLTNSNHEQAVNNNILYLDSVHVDALIHQNGNLEITETQSILLHENLVGVKHYYDLRNDEQYHLLSIERKLPDGTWKMLEEGNLSNFDHYNHNSEERIISWGNRSPDDLTFKSEIIEYRIKSLYIGHIQKTIAGYELFHDFAFSNRIEGNEIKKLKVNIEWHPDWVVVPHSDINRIFTFDNLSPNQGFVVSQIFDFQGRTLYWISLDENFSEYRWGIFIFFLIFLAFVQVYINRQIKKKEVFKDSKNFTSWYEVGNALFGLQPEEVCLIAEHEKYLVSTWLGRLMNENKLWVGVVGASNIYTIKKIAEDSEFSDLDKKIIERLFIGNKTEVSEDELVRHYQQIKQSFNLFHNIKEAFQSKVDQILIDIISKESKSKKNVYGGIGALMQFIFIIYLVFFYFWNDWNSFFPYGYDGNSVAFFFIIYNFHWDTSVSNYFYTVLMFHIGISSCLFLWRISPKWIVDRIQFTKSLLTAAIFIQEKLDSDNPCDVPIGYSSYLPALGVTSSIEKRIQNGKTDCLYLLPENIQTLINMRNIPSNYLSLPESKREESMKHVQSFDFSSASITTPWDSMEAFGKSAIYRYQPPK